MTMENVKISHIFLIWISYYILILIWAHGIKKFSLFVDSIQSHVFYFLSLDHYNYAPWLAVLLRDMRDSFSVNWIVSKRCHRFSASPSDQVPEQEDTHVCKVKGRLHWTDRKRRYQKDLYLLATGTYSDCLHHEEGFSAQRVW